MLALVYGGSGSGKSVHAERLAVQWEPAGPRFYLATMRPVGGDAEERIARHRAARAGKGFVTIELYAGLDAFTPPAPGLALLECLGNLLANEMFPPGGMNAGALETVWRGISLLRERAGKAIVVSNDIGSDGAAHTEETAAYCRALAELNRRLAESADSVIETVCGIPLHRKGTGSCAG